MNKINDTESAMLKFVEAATRHAESTEQGDYKAANKHYSIISRSVTFLKEHNELGKLLGLLNHSSVGVRIWAATYILPISENEGLVVLRQIAGETGIHSFTASTTVNEWLRGNLRL